MRAWPTTHRRPAATAHGVWRRRRGLSMHWSWTLTHAPASRCCGRSAGVACASRRAPAAPRCSGMHSRYAAARLVVPDPRADLDHYAEVILEWLREHPTDVVLTSTDAGLETLHHHRERFAAVTSPAVGAAGGRRDRRVQGAHAGGRRRARHPGAALDRRQLPGQHAGRAGGDRPARRHQALRVVAAAPRRARRARVAGARRDARRRPHARRTSSCDRTAPPWCRRSRPAAARRTSSSSRRARSWPAS